MHDDWSRLYGTKACFIGRLIGGGWFTSYFTIASLTLSSYSSSKPGLSLSLCWMVRSIYGTSGTSVELLDQQPCMKKISLCSYSSFNAAPWNYARSSPDMRLITGTKCGQPQNWNITENIIEKKKISNFDKKQKQIELKLKIKITKLKENNSNAIPDNGVKKFVV